MSSLNNSTTVGAEESLSKSIISYSSAMIFSQVVGIVQGLVLIRWLEPAVLGVWLGLQLIPIYGLHAHFGLINAVNRQVPYHRGRNDFARATNVEDVARANLVMLSAIGLCVLPILYLTGQFSTPAGRGALALILSTIIRINVQFYVGLFRARQQFGKAGLVSVINSLVIFCGLPLVYYLGFDGLLWRAIAAASISYLGCVALDGFLFRLKIDWMETLSLIRIGLPIMVLSYGIVVFSSMDRMLILLFLDETAMGEYAICFAVATIVALLPGLIGQVFYPRMTKSFAVSGITRRLVQICGQASILSGAVAGCICVVSYFALPTAVELLFPKYAPGLPALNVALVAYFLLSFGAGPNHFLISTFQKRRQVAVLLAAAATMILAAYLLSDLGLVGIAWSLVLGVTVNVSGLWMLVLTSLRSAEASKAE